MRHRVLWNLLVALFVCGLLLPGLGAPARAGDFNPQPEPPAEMKPDLNQPVQEEGIDPGEDKTFVHPPEKKGIAPGNDEKLAHPPEKKGIEPGNDKPHALETKPGPVPPAGRKATEPIDKKAMEPLDKRAMDPVDEHAVHPAEEDVTSPRDDRPTPKQPLMKKNTGDGGIPSDTILR